MTDSKLEMAAAGYAQNRANICGSFNVAREEAFKAGAAWAREQNKREPFVPKGLQIMIDSLGERLERIEDKLTGKDAPQPAEGGNTAYDPAAFGVAYGEGSEPLGYFKIPYSDHLQMSIDLAKYRREVPALDAEVLELRAQNEAMRQQIWGSTSHIMAPSHPLEVEISTETQQRFGRQIEELTEQRSELNAEIERLNKTIQGQADTIRQLLADEQAYKLQINRRTEERNNFADKIRQLEDDKLSLLDGLSRKNEHIEAIRRTAAGWTNSK